MSFVFADEWDSFGQENDSSEKTINSSDAKIPGGDSDLPVEDFQDNKPIIVSEDSEGIVYNRNFYLALGIGFIGGLILAYLLYSLLRRPKNKWNK